MKKWKPKRNDLCICGSGKKYKKCHYLKEFEEKKSKKEEMKKRQVLRKLRSRDWSNRQ